jgi:hypothetical protein
MSMSQEEIEALMNGLDIVDDDSSAVQEESPIVNTDEIEELISQNEKVNVDEISEPIETKIEENLETLTVDEISNDTEIDNSQTVDNDDIDELLKNLEPNEPESEESKDILEEVNELEVEPVVNNEITPETFDDIAADDEGIVESTVNKVSEEEKDKSFENEEIGKDWADSKIDQGVFPFPADNDTKVVNQLSQVANDSEEKVSQIFDVLSLTLDNNNDIRSKVDDFEAYITSNLELLTSLNAKFPNIEIFNAQKKVAEEMSNNLKDITNIVNAEDMKIFEAMELMQFNDINRQKIERVMSVIRKLSLYLNNLFEDDGSTQEIAVAKHIHGDTEHDLIGDDLDKLINEFAK